MGSSVHVNQALLITPSQPTPTHILHLSALDSQLFLRFTFEYLLLYKPHPPVDRNLIIKNVKSALASALVPYYPLAGRVRARPDGQGLEVDCRAQGALFIDAISTFTISEFDGAPPHWRNLLSLHVIDVLAGAPPLIVQLTWLLDGAAALAVGFNHCLCDGTGAAQFLKSFAELAMGKRQLTELDPMPTWSRHLLNMPRPTPHHANSVVSHPEFRSVSDVCGFDALFNAKNCRTGSSHPELESVPDLCGFNVRFGKEKLIPTNVTFDRKRINELKERTKSCDTRTSFEVVAAHVWRSWTRALKLSSRQLVKLVFSVNIRERVAPSLPSGYYGNAFVLGGAEASVAELVGEGVGHAAALVARAKERVGDEYVKEVVELVSCRGASVDSVGALIMTQWSRLGLDSVDFGIGRPVQVGPVCSDKYCILLPVCGQPGAVKVNLAVPLTAVNQYLYFLRNIYA